MGVIEEFQEYIIENWFAEKEEEKQRENYIKRLMGEPERGYNILHTPSHTHSLPPCATYSMAPCANTLFSGRHFPTSAQRGDTFYHIDTLTLYVHDGSGWVAVSNDLSGYAGTSGSSGTPGRAGTSGSSGMSGSSGAWFGGDHIYSHSHNTEWCTTSTSPSAGSMYYYHRDKCDCCQKEIDYAVQVRVRGEDKHICMDCVQKSMEGFIEPPPPPKNELDDLFHIE